MPFEVDIANIPTTGAGSSTANQLNPRQPKGVASSYALAKEDADRMKEFRSDILDVAKETKIDPSFIAAIISRETRAGNYLGSDGWNSERIAYGIMQVHEMHKPDKWRPKSRQHILQASRLLAGFIEDTKTCWSAELRYKVGIAAYNCGPRNVNPEDIDCNTEGRDYANDVVARAKWYKASGY